MKGVNKAIIVGQLGKDPEVLTGITKFSVATSEDWLDKNSVKQSKTEWHNCVCFGKLAEIAGKYLKKCSKVYIEGKIETNKWEKDGVTRYSTSINVRELQMLDSKPAESKPDSKQAASGDDTFFNDEINF